MYFYLNTHQKMPGRSAKYFTTLTSTLIECLRLIPKNVYHMLISTSNDILSNEAALLQLARPN